MSLPSEDTIFALSSGLPPAGIAIIRISGPGSGAVLQALAGQLPVARRASYRALRDPRSGALLDHGLALWFPGPRTATGEDLAELHVHGGRAVVAALLATIGEIDGTRPGEAGEFTRRAFANGCIDLSEAEGLVDLLAAETELQRQSALALAEGGLGRQVNRWQAELLRISAALEAALDFSDEGDVPPAAEDGQQNSITNLANEIITLLAEPGAERLRDGVRVVLAGPPNSGKSSIFNYLANRDAAIVSEIAGTTRDRIEAPVAIDGVPLILIDTAGLRESDDAIEAMGVTRAEEAISSADILLWLGDVADIPDGAIQLATKSDLHEGTARVGLATSVRSGDGLALLRREIVDRARASLPKSGALALNQRHRSILADVLAALDLASREADFIIVAEHLRQARNDLNRLTGKAGVEDMLDALFGAMCIGK